MKYLFPENQTRDMVLHFVDKYDVFRGCHGIWKTSLRPRTSTSILAPSLSMDMGPSRSVRNTRAPMRVRRSNVCASGGGIRCPRQH